MHLTGSQNTWSKMTELKKETNNSTIIVGDVNTSFLIRDVTSMEDQQANRRLQHQKPTIPNRHL